MNEIKVITENDEKLGEIVYTHDKINNIVISYLKRDERIVVKESTKEKAYQELKRVYKRLKEHD